VPFLTLKEKNYGGTFRATITDVLTKIAGFAYVDDTDLTQTKQYEKGTIVDIVTELQCSLDV